MNRSKHSFACSACTYVARDGYDLRKHSGRVHEHPGRVIVDGVCINTKADGYLKPTDKPGVDGMHSAQPDSGHVVWHPVRVG